jgi:fumarylacetoacetase
VRPSGQLAVDKDDHSKGSLFSPCRLLDFELEIAAFLGGKANHLGRPLTIAEAEDRIFGLTLMNDW